mmetsp:Transcript_27171/g.44690  ORF Transcript_27171/g.44690 Transcript_27171/m.44690 type:complete len:91 (+) Transcript_27171:1031-1303(+)
MGRSLSNAGTREPLARWGQTVRSPRPPHRQDVEWTRRTMAGAAVRQATAAVAQAAATRAVATRAATVVAARRTAARHVAQLDKGQSGSAV